MIGFPLRFRQAVPLCSIDVGLGLGEHASVEVDAARGEGGIVAVDRDHRAAVGALLAGEEVVVAAVADHLHRHILLALDEDLCVAVDGHLVEDGNHVALLVGAGEGLLEGVQVVVGIFAAESGEFRLVTAGVRVHGDAVALDAVLGGGQVDGVAMGAGLHVDRQVEAVGILRLVVALAVIAHQVHHHLAHVAFAIGLGIDAAAVEVESHHHGGLAAAVEGAQRLAVDGGGTGDRLVENGVAAVLIVGILISAGDALLVGSVAGQGVEVLLLVDGHHLSVPTHRGGQGVRHIVGHIELHAEAVGLIDGVAGDLLLLVGHVEGGGVGGCAEPVAVVVGRGPGDAFEVHLAGLQRGGQHHLALEDVGAAFVVHGQHLVFHVGELLQHGAEGDLHLDGFVQVHAILVVLVELQADGAEDGVAEAVVVEHVELEFGRHVLVLAHQGGGEVGDHVHVAVAREGGSAVPGTVACVRGGRHQVAAAVPREVGTRHHHQAEVGVRVLVDVVDALQRHAFGTAVVRQGFDGSVGGILDLGVIVGGAGVGRGDAPLVFQAVGLAIGPGDGQVALVHQAHLFVLVGQVDALGVVDHIVVARFGGRQGQGAVGDGQVVVRSGAVVAALQGDLLVVCQCLVGVGVGLHHGEAAARAVAERPHSVLRAVVVVRVFRAIVQLRCIGCTPIEYVIIATGNDPQQGVADGDETAVVIVGAAVLGRCRDDGAAVLRGQQVGEAVNLRIDTAGIDEVDVDTVVDHQGGVGVGRLVEVAQLVADVGGSVYVAERVVVAAGQVGVRRQVARVVGVGRLLPVVDLADVGDGVVHVNHVVAHGVEGVEAVEGDLVAEVGRDGVG